MSAIRTEESRPTTEARPGDATRRLLRHMVATLAYRAAKVLRDAPRDFGSFSLAGRRPAVQIVAHMGDLMTWALRMANGEYKWKAEGSANWDVEVRRFFAALAAFDARLAEDAPLGYPPETLVQGAISDALTHVGQIAMLRGAAGAEIRPESHARAEIVIGRVGPNQAPPKREFDGDASAR